VQKPPSLSSSQSSSTGSSLPSSTGAGVPPSAAGARSVRQSSYAQSYLTAAGANQSNNNPVMRSAALSRSAAGPSVYANVAEQVGAASGRARMQPAGMLLTYACITVLCRSSCSLVIKVGMTYCQTSAPWSMLFCAHSVWEFSGGLLDVMGILQRLCRKQMI